MLKGEFLREAANFTLIAKAVLIEGGSAQKNVWGADWFSHSKEVTFESLINIRPRDGNSSLEVQSVDLRNRIEEIVRDHFEG